MTHDEFIKEVESIPLDYLIRWVEGFVSTFELSYLGLDSRWMARFRGGNAMSHGATGRRAIDAILGMLHQAELLASVLDDYRKSIQPEPQAPPATKGRRK
jgi:hypothetical protein